MVARIQTKNTKLEKRDAYRSANVLKTNHKPS